MNLGNPLNRLQSDDGKPIKVPLHRRLSIKRSHVATGVLALVGCIITISAITKAMLRRTK